MLNYAETASSSTTVPLTGVPSSRQPTSPEWIIDENLDCLRYRGKHGEVYIPGVMRMGCDAAFAQDSGGDAR